MLTALPDSLKQSRSAGLNLPQTGEHESQYIQCPLWLMRITRLVRHASLSA